MGGEVQSHMEDSITAFGRFLRQVGFEIGTGEIMNAIHAVETVGILRKDDFASACLLCSEETADQCHRRLVADYLTEKWGDVNITHL